MKELSIFVFQGFVLVENRMYPIFDHLYYLGLSYHHPCSHPLFHR